MDHSMHEHHASTGAVVSETHMMHSIVFHFSKSADLLFSGLSTTKIGYSQQILICILAGCFGVILKLFRHIMEIRFLKMTCNKDDDKNSQKQTIIFKMIIINLARALIIMLTLSWDYFLMLAAMTMNVGIFCAIVGGVAIGFLFCGHLFTLPFKSILIRPTNEIACGIYHEQEQTTKDNSPDSTKFYHQPWSVTTEPTCCTSI